MVVAPAEDHWPSLASPVYDSSLTGETRAPVSSTRPLAFSPKRIMAHRAMLELTQPHSIVNLGIGAPEVALSSFLIPYTVFARLLRLNLHPPFSIAFPSQAFHVVFQVAQSTSRFVRLSTYPQQAPLNPLAGHICVPRLPAFLVKHMSLEAAWLSSNDNPLFYKLKLHLRVLSYWILFK